MMETLRIIIFIILMSDAVTHLLSFPNSNLNTEYNAEYETFDDIENIESGDFKTLEEKTIRYQSYTSFWNFLFFIWATDIWVAVFVMSIILLLILCLPICIRSRRRCRTIFVNCFYSSPEVELPQLRIGAHIATIPYRPNNVNFHEVYEMQNVSTVENV